MAYIKEENLKQIYDDHTQHMADLFKPFDEFERIARNRPHAGIAKGLPRVTDGTLSGLIQEQPKRIIQQIPTGSIESHNDWLDIMAGFIFEKEILPHANLMAALIQKCWAMTSKSLTYGSQPVYVQFVNRPDYIGTDFSLPYIKDVFLEPGKLSDKDSNVILMRSWYRPNDIDLIIEKEKTLSKRAKERGEKYEHTWDVTVLEAAKKQAKEKQQESQTANEKDKNTKSEVIEIMHAFQRGVGAMFYSFCPDLPENANVVRRKANKDPRGGLPIHYMFANVDLSNPLGRGAVELSGGMQNLLDSEVQSYQYMRALMMNPPLEIKGNVRSSVIKYAPAAHWKLGTDPNASVRPVELSTSSLESFPQNYGLIKSQILNLNSSTDTSVSADVGNPGFSKTPAGVNAMESKLGVSDNYMRKQFEACFEDVAETMINLYFAERSGIHEIQVDKDTAMKLRKLDPAHVGPNNMVRIDFDTETAKMKFQVDASTSSVNDDAAERDRLVELLDLSGKYPQFAELLGEDGTKELINRIIIKSGVEDPEKIMPQADDNEVDEEGNPIASQPQEQAMTPETVQQMITEIVGPMMDELAAETKQDDMTKALIGKFDSLPEETKMALLEQFGLPSGQSPKAKELGIKEFDTAQRAAGPSDVELEQQDLSRESNVQEVGEVEPLDNLTPELDEDDQMLMDALEQRGFSEEQIANTVAMLKDGAELKDILPMLTGAKQ